MDSGYAELPPVADACLPCEPGFGDTTFGEEPFGGDPPFGVASAVAVRENAIRVRFTLPMLWSALGVAGDAADPANYAILADPATTGLDGASARQVFPARVQLPEEPDGYTVELWTDRPMTPWPAVYAVSAFGVRGESGEAAEECALSFHGAYRQLVPKVPQVAGPTGADISNPQAITPGMPEGAVAGGFSATGDGDYALDGPAQATHKRLIRMLISHVDGFAHLPDYGLGAVDEVKKLATSGRLEDLAARAQKKLLRDPDVAQARARVEKRGVNTFGLVAVVKTRSSATLRLDVPFST